jgi:hypothetical protein
MRKSILFIVLLFPITFYAQNDIELNTVLMNSTFRIEGSGKTGTVFIIGKPSTKDSLKAFFVLVTANHVLNDIKTDNATLFLRKEVNKRFYKMPTTIKIRNNGIPLWVKHPEADVAAMYVSLPKDLSISLLPTFFLANDSLITEFEIHPGDELLCLGFPYGAEANDAGFPILRSGKISSYPITPTKEIKSFLFDFQVFGGNSGGPVYFIGLNRSYKGGVLGEVRFIIGLVSEELVVEEQVISMDEISLKKHPLSLAKVIPSTFIKETIDLLPIIE